MPVRVNRAALEAVEFRSDQLSVLGNLIHPISRSAKFVGAAVDEAGASFPFHLEISETSSNPPQVSIDLSVVAKVRRPGTEPKFVAGLDGGTAYCLFFVSEGTSRFYITLTEVDAPSQNREGSRRSKRIERDEKGAVLEFDSRSLLKGDVFITLLIRDGTYEANVIGADGASLGPTASIVVSPLVGISGPYQGAVASSKVSDLGFDPAKIAINSTDSVVFEIEAPVRVKVARVSQKDDEEKSARSPWRKWNFGHNPSNGKDPPDRAERRRAASKRRRADHKR